MDFPFTTFDYDLWHYRQALRCRCSDCKSEAKRYEAAMARRLLPPTENRGSVFTSAIATAYKETMRDMAEVDDE